MGHFDKTDPTSFSGKVLFCLRRKSKSWPSMNSSTVQKLRDVIDDHEREVCILYLRVGINLKDIKQLHNVLGGWSQVT